VSVYDLVRLVVVRRCCVVCMCFRFFVGCGRFC